MIFDTRAPVGTDRVVYVSTVAEELEGADLDGGIVIFSRRSEAHGASLWKPEGVWPPAFIACTGRLCRNTGCSIRPSA